MGTRTHTFIEGLVSDGPAPEHADKLMLYGQFVGEWTADANTLSMRSPGECGRDYRIKNVVLVEVSFCAFPDSVPGIVMTNIMDRVPD